jgi:hypothetical protein
MLQPTAGLIRADAEETPFAVEPALARTLGLARLSRACGEPDELQPLFEALKARALGEEADPGALLDVGTLLVATGSREQGLDVQAAAIGEQKLYLRPASAQRTLRLLAFMRHGDFTANTPLDFLLEESGVELVQCYIDGPPAPQDVPDHDVAFLAIGEAPEAAALLASLEGVFDAWPRPVLNARADLIAALTRDGVCARLAGCEGLLSPAVQPVARADLQRVADGETPAAVFGEAFDFPFIARPFGTHAGVGMEKIASTSELAAYLLGEDAETFYVTAFVDYAGADGLFRKYRIVFIDGRPFLSHMAVSPRWMVHYLNADMEENAANRAEEALAMETFDEGFAARHAAAFRRLCEAYPFDYFGIDCAETPDGRLLVFEADVAMIVHAMDPADLYPYKKPAMAKLFAAFVGMLERRANAARS